MDRRSFVKALAAAPFLKYASLPAVAADATMLTHTPDWPRSQFDASLLSDTPIGDEHYTAIRAAVQRLADREGQSFDVIGKHICQRHDLLNSPWQLYVAVG